MTESTDNTSAGQVQTRRDEAAPAMNPAGDAPRQHIGRCRIEKLLGEGSFGRVYLARDDQLDRWVAIKVPHRRRIARAEDVEAYLAEARVLASLDHPHIVPVYDVGRTEDGLCFVISKFIEGRDLALRMKEARIDATGATELVATIAEALHHAHRRGLVHRDIKPANILLDRAGQPYLTDFGLALKDEDYGKTPEFAGSPAYMSPEQARGEGHRVDGRSDIFSLAVVFYELLTRRRPFRGDTRAEVLREIIGFEPRPPRQLDDAIPKELERICLKALAKRASERYTTARDFADDLRHFFKHATQMDSTAPEPAAPVGGTPQPVTSPAPSSELGPVAIKIVPKGLRSYDAKDADFFLALLPGPRDRDGLPESIRFWKSRIDETDRDNTFSVGLIYGPSGSGKSSLLKAGILPRLGPHVRAIYVEATAEETEARLLKALRKNFPDLSVDLGLAESLAMLRRARGLQGGSKVLLVVDQFEQWLHARGAQENPVMVEALRHCDGATVQCLVAVRDDLWMAASRFMRALEVPLLEGQNSAAADLFDLRHARKILALFGQAFGALPERAADMTPEHQAFLEQAVAGLAREEKVISVRLALFAEMVKARVWHPATLRAVGGMEGVGVTFLEETFSAANALPQHRLHQKAARAVLQRLLPDAGANIKGNMRSRQELCQAAAYTGQPREFDELLRILDSELRLITPTDPEGVPGEESQAVQAASDIKTDKYYQLTHDYLVPAVREWLSRKQRATWTGRTELRLAEQALLWQARRENRFLPNLWEWSAMRLLTRPRDWTAPQQEMMHRATRYHALRGAALGLLLVLLILSGLGIGHEVREYNKATLARGLVDSLLRAGSANVPGIIEHIERYRRWADPLLREEFARAKEGSVQKLYTSIALLPVDPTQSDYLYERLLSADPADLPCIRDALRDHRTSLVTDLWKVLNNSQEDADRRFRAACALATCDSQGSAVGGAPWQQASRFIVDRLLVEVEKNPSHYAVMRELLHPVREKLLPSLALVYRDKKRQESDRTFAANVLADYARDQPDFLADLLMDAELKQFPVLFPRVEAQGANALGRLQETLRGDVSSRRTDEEKEELANRQANAGIALIKTGQADLVWPLLQHRPDPRTRSYLTHRFAPLAVDPAILMQRLEKEKEVSIRRALLLSLGEYEADQVPAGQRQTFLNTLLGAYRTDSDAGVHGASEWLLRRWKQEDDLRTVDKELATEISAAQRGWYVNKQGQTMVVIRGGVEFAMGSPPDEAGSFADEDLPLQRWRIARTFAIAARQVTVEQFLRFRGEHKPLRRYAPTDDCPAHEMTWYLAAEYCNWLSRKEDLPREEWCYEPNKAGEYADGMRLAPHYLKRTGYRLPTSAEWEFACRAGAMTSRYYGESEGLLHHYGWYLLNSAQHSWPVGSLKPNDLGLFDMHGNVWNWCQDSDRAYALVQQGKIMEDNDDLTLVTNAERRMLRGGSFGRQAVNIRSAFALRVLPTYHDNDVGLRPARTLR
jgi:serine/threonine protein kinase/formylglycine-generating enzyme required for sulfatase activity